MIHFSTLTIAAIVLVVITRDSNIVTYVIFAGAAAYFLLFVWLSGSKHWLAKLGLLVAIFALPLAAYAFLREYQAAAAVEILVAVVREVFLPFALALIAIISASRIRMHFARKKLEQTNARP